MRFAALALALATTLPALAQDKVEIKWNPKKGTKATRFLEIKGDGSSSQDIGGGGGMKITIMQNADVNCGLKWAEEITEVKSGAAVAIKRLYTRADYNVMLGWYGGQSGKRGLGGKEVKWADGKWEGKDLDEDDAKRMKADDGLTAALATGKVIAKGDSWDADKDKLEDWLEGVLIAIKLSKVEGKCEFEAVEDKEGAKCVRIELSVKANAKLGDADDKPLSLSFKGDAFYNIEAGMVIEFKAEGRLKHAKKEGEEDEEEDKIKLDVPLDVKYTVKLGEADFDAKPEEPPRPPKPDWWPEPVR